MQSDPVIPPIPVVRFVRSAAQQSARTSVRSTTRAAVLYAAIDMRSEVRRYVCVRAGAAVARIDTKV